MQVHGIYTASTAQCGAALALLDSMLITHALATLRDAAACTSAMSKARTQIEQLKPDNDLPWLYWMSPANITAGAGNCLLKLGRADQATRLLEEGITLQMRPHAKVPAVRDFSERARGLVKS
ncbi:MAG: hypothetical protein ACT4NY_23160 [Pseudonocardiales bacterium]